MLVKITVSAVKAPFLEDFLTFLKDFFNFGKHVYADFVLPKVSVNKSSEICISTRLSSIVFIICFFYSNFGANSWL